MAQDTARLKELLPLITSTWKIENGAIKDDSGTWVMQLFSSPEMSKEDYQKRLEIVALAMNALPELVAENETSTGISLAIEKVVAGIVDTIIDEKLKEHSDQRHAIWGK